MVDFLAAFIIFILQNCKDVELGSRNLFDEQPLAKFIIITPITLYLLLHVACVVIVPLAADPEN